jgi:signal transduction histidine kinase
MRYKRLIFSVEDSGIGIKEEDYEKLFKIFGKLEQTENVNPSGIGLGLTICNKILHEMGSKLEIKSTYGIGSTFYFIIDLIYK